MARLVALNAAMQRAREIHALRVAVRTSPVFRARAGKAIKVLKVLKFKDLNIQRWV